MQASLFDFGIPAFDPRLGGIQHTDLGGGAWVDYLPHWLGGHEVVYRDLADAADWKQGRRLMYDRTVAVPRLTAPAPESGPGARVLLAMGEALEEHYGVGFEGITLAWYRDGRDSVAPHGDRIGRLCDDTVVAIVSVGAPRRFLLHPAGGGRSLSPAGAICWSWAAVASAPGCTACPRWRGRIRASASSSAGWTPEPE